MARVARFRARHPRLALVRAVLSWLAIPVVVIAWIVVPGAGSAIAVLIGLLWLLLQGFALGRSKSLSWNGYARTFVWSALLAPAIAGIEIAIGSLVGWHPADQAPTVALAGPVEETLKLLPLAAVFLLARNRWRRLGTADFALLGLAAGAGFQFAEDTIRRVVASAQPQPPSESLLSLILGLHGTNGVATDYGFLQLFPGGETLGHPSLGGLADVTVFPGHGVLTALIAVGIGFAVRGRRRVGRKVWLVPLALWVAAVMNHMVANYSTYGGRVSGQPWVTLPGVMTTLVHVWYALGGAYLLLLLLFVGAVVLDYRTIAGFEDRLPELPGRLPAERLRGSGGRRGDALRGSLPSDAAPSIRGATELLAASAQWSAEALARAWHEVVVLGACAGTHSGLWFAGMRWVRARRELAYGLWRVDGRGRLRRPSEEGLRRHGEMIRAALARAVVPAGVAAACLAALLTGSSHVVSDVHQGFIAGLLGDFGRWWSHLSLGEQVLSVLGVGAILGLMGMDLLPAIGLATGASTFADFSPLAASFIRAPGRTVREVLRNLTPAQALALGAGFLLQRLLPAAGGRLVGGELRDDLAGVVADTGSEEAPSTPLVPGGGLVAHEVGRGHTLERHVGLTDSDLLERVAQGRVLRASTFYNREVAETSISRVLDANSAHIREWLAGDEPKLELNGSMPAPVGRSVEQGSTTVLDVSGVRVVLIRDPASPVGYRILTAFPQP